MLVKGDKIYFQHSSITELIPIVIMLKAFGASSDYHACQLIGPEDEIMSFLIPSMEDAIQRGIFNSEQV